MEIKLTTNEIKLLKELVKGGGERVGEICSSLDISYPSLSRTLNSLEKKGLVKTEKYGFSKKMYFSDLKHAIILKTLLVEFAHVKFETFLSGASIKILLFLSNFPLNRKKIMFYTRLSEKTIHTKLKLLREFGIVLSEKGQYRLNERFVFLKDFILEFMRYLNLNTAQKFVKDAVILWQQADEFLIKTAEYKEMKNFFLTSITAFHKYGIELFLPDHYYYYYTERKEKLNPEDLILHALVLDPTDTRVIMSVLLLIKKNKIDVEYLVKESEKYQLKPTIHDLLNYTRTEGEIKPIHFPTWKEYEAKVKEYRL